MGAYYALTYAAWHQAQKHPADTVDPWMAAAIVATIYILALLMAYQALLLSEARKLWRKL